jgi:hypothetical protein
MELVNSQLKYVSKSRLKILNLKPLKYRKNVITCVFKYISLRYMCKLFQIMPKMQWVVYSARRSDIKSYFMLPKIRPPQLPYTRSAVLYPLTILSFDAVQNQLVSSSLNKPRINKPAIRNFYQVF